jgi:hypothetical protein
VVVGVVVLVVVVLVVVVVVEVVLATLFTPKPLIGFEEDRLAGPVVVSVAGLVVMGGPVTKAVVCIKQWAGMCRKLRGIMRPLWGLTGGMVVLVLEGMVW